MSYELFCDHCCKEVTVPEDWSHWCCLECQAAGHTLGRNDECQICTKAFSDAIKAISAGINERVLREGLICVKPSTSMNLRLNQHYKVVSIQDEWVTVIDDSGEARAYEANLFRSVRENDLRNATTPHTPAAEPGEGEG